MNSWDIRKPMRTLCLCLLSITIVGALTSCASNIAKVPASWSKNAQPPAQGCTDLSGIYRNKGIDAPDNKDKDNHKNYPQYLSDFLVSGTLVAGRKHKWVTHIELVGVKQGELTAFIKKQDKTIDTEVLKQGQDFTCTPNGIEITSSYTKIYEIGGGFGKRTTTLTLNKSINDSIVITAQEKEIGAMIAVIPFSDEVIQYYKFPAMGTMP
ncbi:MAG: hypothetical protein Q9M21_09290 [Mariprofundaceae bacterium]|nr:hypothetical protein [Mariprofundaceae bacterium]